MNPQNHQRVTHSIAHCTLHSRLTTLVSRHTVAVTVAATVAATVTVTCCLLLLSVTVTVMYRIELILEGCCRGALAVFVGRVCARTTAVKLPSVISIMYHPWYHQHHPQHKLLYLRKIIILYWKVEHEEGGARAMLVPPRVL